MKSTIRSFAAIALSIASVTAFAANPTVGERNFDLMNSWFTPQSADHPDQKKAEAARKELAMAAKKTKADNAVAQRQRTTETNTSM